MNLITWSCWSCSAFTATKKILLSSYPTALLCNNHTLFCVKKILRSDSLLFKCIHYSVTQYCVVVVDFQEIDAEVLAHSFEFSRKCSNTPFYKHWLFLDQLRLCWMFLIIEPEFMLKTFIISRIFPTLPGIILKVSHSYAYY